MRTSTIRAIAPNGQWNGMDKHLITMADGVQYTFFIEAGKPFPKGLNDEITFAGNQRRAYERKARRQDVRQAVSENL
jgi:hypothetical protein